jgi:saposin
MKGIVVLLVLALAFCASAGQILVKPETNQVECELCTFIFSTIESQLSTNPTEAEVEQVVEKVCTALPASISNICDEIVVAYFPQIVSLLVAKEPASRICSQIKMCKADVPQKENVVVIPMSAQAFAPKPLGGAVECSICTLVMTTIENELAGNTTEAQVEKVLDEVCNILPKEIQGLCTDLIQQYYPTLVQLLINKEPAATICQQIGMCSSKKAKAAPAPEGNLECEACTYIFNVIYSELSNNATEAEIEAVLDKACSIVPSALSGVCQDLINQYFPQIVELLLAREPAATICAQIKMCKSSSLQATTLVRERVPMSVSGTVECSICELVMTEVEKLLAGNTTEAQVEKVLDEVCDILPKEIQGLCTDLINQYYPTLVQLLVNKESPSAICTQIGLCKSTAPRTTKVVRMAAPAPKAQDLCLLCEFVVKYVELYIAENKTEAKIQEALDKVCSLLPSPKEQNGCDTIVGGSTEHLIQLFLADEPIDKACGPTQLRMCPSSFEMVGRPMHKKAHHNKKHGKKHSKKH